MTRPFYLLVILIVLWVPLSMAQQTGQIAGKVVDESSGETLVGVTVLVETTTLGVASDIEGKFEIRNVPEGSCTVRLSSIGYATKIIRDVAIVPGKTVTLNVTMVPETYSVREVVVEAQAVMNNESALLSERKKAVTIGDGISAEQVKRTPDATSGDALRRVTGVTIVENKFVFVRGITDRYNGTMLDGASVTSTEAGKRSFSFDMVPANLLDYTSVIKSATPDLPGDFSGGLVQLNTLDFPDNRVLKVSLSSSYNSVTTSRNVLTSQSGSRDWLGFDDGGRSFPSDVTDAQALAVRAPNDWAPRSRRAPFNSAFSLSFGDHLAFGDGSATNDQMGFIGALSYKNGFQRSEKVIDDKETGRFNVGAADDRSILWGGIANVSYKISGYHKLSFKNNYNRSAEDHVARFLSDDLNTTQQNLYTVLQWTQRSTYTGMLSGEHVLPSLLGLTLQWRASVSSSARQDPDGKQVAYYHDLYDTTQPYTAAINQRSWGHMNERTESFGLDATIPVSNMKAKFGGIVEGRTTNYGIRYFNVTPDYFGGIPDSLTHLPLETIYDTDHFGKGKFIFGESSKASDSYVGDQKTFATYFMLDAPFSLLEGNFRAAGGARLENWEQNVHVPRTLVAGGPVESTHRKKIDVLPSLNFTYLVNPQMNLRLAYSQSVNRPDFREIASTGFYDFIKYELVGGNPDLDRSYIHNYDARLELFPQVGEVIAVSYFYKSISGAIEERLMQSAVRTRTWFNSSHAKSYGWEIEVRKSLEFLGSYLRNFSVTGNYTRINSAVEYTETRGNSEHTYFVEATRPLQGQSPYVINFSLQFTEPTLGTTLSVLYNKFGRRLETVGFLASDIYEEPRDLVDFSITQPLFRSLELKLTGKNITGKDRVLVREAAPYERTTIGTTWGLQISANL